MLQISRRVNLNFKISVFSPPFLGKDLSSRTETDLNCIFGKRARSAKEQEQVRDVTIYVTHNFNNIYIKHLSKTSHR